MLYKVMLAAAMPLVAGDVSFRFCGVAGTETADADAIADSLKDEGSGRSDYFWRELEDFSPSLGACPSPYDTWDGVAWTSLGEYCEWTFWGLGTDTITGTISHLHSTATGLDEVTSTDQNGEEFTLEREVSQWIRGVNDQDHTGCSEIEADVDLPCGPYDPIIKARLQMNVPGMTFTGHKFVSGSKIPNDCYHREGQEHKNPCFPSSALVTMADGTQKTMDKLTAGDKILAAKADGSVGLDTVTPFSIANPNEMGTFYQLKTAKGKTLNVTTDHHIPTGDECCSNVKKVKEVKVGDTIYAVETYGIVRGHKVASKQMIAHPMQGLHSPVLADGGFPVVNGVVTSFDAAGSVKAASVGMGFLETIGLSNFWRTHFMSGNYMYIDNRH